MIGAEAGGGRVGSVRGLFVTADGGEPMRSLEEVRAEEGVGLAGDRYATGRGLWSGKGDDPLTLVAEEDIERASAELGVPLDAAVLRRNVLTRGVGASTLIGRRFRVGSAVVEGIRACAPCGYLESLTGVSGLKAALEGRGGVRARILRSGTIRVGDGIHLL